MGESPGCNGKKTEKKKEELALEREEDAAKKTDAAVDFKPLKSDGFQTGADTMSGRSRRAR